MEGFRSPVLLTSAHATATFDCGSPAQTNWLRKYAILAQASGSSRVYVATPGDRPEVRATTRSPRARSDPSKHRNVFSGDSEDTTFLSSS